MKNIFLAIVLLLSFQSFSQNKTSTQAKRAQTTNEDKVVKKALYTNKERSQARKNFLKEVDKMGLKPEVKKQYLEIVDKNSERMRAINKDRKLTKKQATYYVNKVTAEQDQAIKHILTVEEFKKHEIIAERYKNSALYRIEKQ